jgi:hypothetical protein
MVVPKLDQQQVIGALKSTGSIDPEVLYLKKEEMLSESQKVKTASDLRIRCWRRHVGYDHRRGYWHTGHLVRPSGQQNNPEQCQHSGQRLRRLRRFLEAQSSRRQAMTGRGKVVRVAAGGEAGRFSEEEREE